MSKGNLREAMPVVTALIDDLRKTFGQAGIDGQVRRGMKGESCFWASENGHEIGTRDTTAKSCVSWDEKGRAYAYAIPAGTSVDDTEKMKKNALEKANARAFNRAGLVAASQHTTEGKKDD